MIPSDPSSASPFDGRSALVTGAASGFGREAAIKLARAGANLLLADIDSDGGRTTAELTGGSFVRADVSSLEENLALVHEAEELHGGLDLAFLNAGVATGCGLGEDFDPALYRRAMGANLDGVCFGVHAAIAAMRRRGGGSIVATSSLAGLTAVPPDPIYAANKHAVVGLTRSLGPGLAAEGIRINAICPGFADTPIIASFKSELEASGIPIIAPETVAETALRLLAGEESGECWFIQPGRDPAPFRFRNLPGPRA
jgi:NAD(P)-dependent dehydrogenase (short-subunit alcohol dehydrogenase family)